MAASEVPVTAAGEAVPRSRRAPVQERSRQRMESILETTAALVDRLGPDQVTTTLIADHLGISVGSIYAYFHDRSAIFDAIVARSIAAHDELITATRASFGDVSWFDASFAVIDCLAEVYRTEPGFRSLWFSQYVSAEMLEAMRRSDEAQAHHLLEQLAVSGYRLECDSPIDAMRMYVGLIDKGLDLAFRTNPDGDPLMIAETKQVVRHYIGAYLRQVPADGPTGGRRRSDAPVQRTRAARTAVGSAVAAP